MKILIVDDNYELVKALTTGFKLQWPDCEVAGAANGQRALALLSSESPDIVLLDVSMPGMDGFEVLRRIRDVSEVPVIMLTVRGEEYDKVRALEMGADDYVTKPFGSLELIARVKAMLRRASLPAPEETAAPFTRCGLTIDYGTRSVSLHGAPVKLTPTEYRLLCALARHPNTLLSRQALLSRVWGSEYLGENDLLKVYIKRLRDKLEIEPAHPRLILTEWGRGYMLSAP